MKLKPFLFVATSSVMLFSCVSSKKFKAAQNDYTLLETKYTTLQGELNACNDEKANLNRLKTGLENDNASLNGKIDDLNKQLEFMKATNTSALKQLEDLSVITSAQAESI